MTIEKRMLAGFVVTLLVAGSAAAQPAAAKGAVERGAYLVTIGGCNDCHTPWKMGSKGPEPDLTKLLSGHPQGMQMPPAPAPAGPWIWSGSGTMTAFSGPWGVSFATNLTPDEETGIGSWDRKTFVEALRNGKHAGRGRPILPPMPWQNLAQATDEDLAAIFAYLQSIPPLKNRVPDPIAPAQAPPAK